MIRAASLFYAMMVALLMACLLSGILWTSHYRSLRTEQWIARVRCRDHALAAMGAPLATWNGVALVSDSFDLFGGNDAPVNIATSPWGVYDVRKVVARSADQVDVRLALIGTRISDGGFFVADHDEPIALAGKVELDVPCYLPRSGVRKAYIEGKPYEGPLAFPVVNQSASTIKDLPERLRLRLRSYGSMDRSTLSLAEPFRMIEGSMLHRSFMERPVVFDLGGLVRLPAVELSGPVLLYSADSVVLPKGLHASGLVVRARHITIEHGFKGDLQCFTDQGIDVEDDVELRYPSALVCMPSPAAAAAVIKLGERVRISGAVVGYEPDAGRVALEFGNDDHVRGEVWCDGMTQLHGQCSGSVHTEGLILRTPSSVYRGHLMNFSIGAMDAPCFAGCGIEEKNKTAVLAWLQ